MAEVPVAEPVSLYLDLVPGKKADLEIVARAILAFAGAIRDAAYVVDPSLQLRIELVSGTESSLSINGLLTASARAQITKLTLRAVAFGAITWFTHHALDYAFQKTLDSVLADGPAPGVSQEQVETIVRRTIDAYQRQAAPRVEEVYRELEADPAIAGVGATREVGQRPETIIPRTEFASRATAAPASAANPGLDRARRDRITIETLTLVSPVLLESKRKWRFIGKDGEFGAAMKDGLFLDNLLRGRVAIPMVAGIRLEVELQTLEDPIEGGAWLVKQRNVLRVRRVNAPPTQIQLGLHPTQPRQPPGGRTKQ